jgi:hypothetical protein
MRRRYPSPSSSPRLTTTIVETIPVHSAWHATRTVSTISTDIIDGRTF